MNKTAFSTKNMPMQAIPQPKPAQKRPKGFDKADWDLAINLETIKSFIKFSVAQPHLVSRMDIAEVLEAARGALTDPNFDHTQKREIRYLLFTTFAEVSMATHDEEVRREAEKARDSIPYPFGEKYGRVFGKPQYL